ncbi:MAG: hypothetical protein KGY81_08695 [Phycisphaerae bacterium]|nr:hypothetical protein [Phycisphaerae bacterium]
MPIRLAVAWVGQLGTGRVLAINPARAASQLNHPNLTADAATRAIDRLAARTRSFNSTWQTKRCRGRPAPSRPPGISSHA